MNRTAAAILAALVVAVVTLLGLMPLTGCTSTIKGGTSASTDDHATVTTGTQTSLTDNVWMKWGARQRDLLRDTLLTSYPDGKVTIEFRHREATSQPADESRHEHREATSQPVTTETTHHATSATQPSASSPTGLPKFKFNGDGELTGIGFDVDAVAEQLKARVWMAGPFVLAAIAFVLLSKWGKAAACVVAAVVIVAVPAWLVIGAIIVLALAIVGWVVWELEVKHRNLAELKADVRAIGAGINTQPAAGTPAADV